MIVLVTGPSGAGKTRICEYAVGLASQNGEVATGILCPGLELDGERFAILARALPGGETRTLARRRVSGETELTTQKWSFDPEVVAWADDHLRDAPPMPLLVVDELGPLELERDEGFVSALARLDAGDFRLALVVVRPSLLPIAQKRWPDAQVIDVLQGDDLGPYL